ncbi:hypothetical protein Pcinc_000025 [Petrolisthes cinctipes]|uniref:Doublecortin domain-containing protein n=1 Tax=Petrolisthes cinctipes TaxID=88211 RepID=A0AAE1GQD3_PETCI|nr:hypothetical protein Pcinc_000025 [Petrolisthes cinctipes]
MSKEMQEAKKRRAVAKGWATRSVKELQDLFDDDTTSFELLDAAVSVFDHRLAAFDEQQTAVELSVPPPLLLEDDSDLEADMDETDKFHKYARKIRAEAAKRLKGARDGSDNASTSTKDRGKGANQCDSLWKLQDQLLRHVRSLEGLGINGDQYGVMLTPVILSRLPQDIRLEWSRESSGHEGDLEWLLKFLQTEIQRHERSETFKDLYVEKINIRQDVERKTVSSASALQTSAEEGPPQCAFCQKRHKTEKCWHILTLNIHDREEKTKQAGLCFKCLLKGHVSRGCKGKVMCTLCNGHHNVLFCRVGKPYSDNNKLPGKQVVTHKSNGQVNIQSSDAANTSTVEHVGISHDQRVKKSTVLQTAKVKVLSKGGKSVVATVMFDLGADTTYVSHDFVKRIKPKWITSTYTSYSAFGNKKSQGSQERNVYDVKLIDSEGNNHSVFAVDVTTICPPLSRQRVPYDVLRSLSHLQLADDYEHDRDLTLDILVGVDNYWRFVSADNVVRFDDLVVHESKFGWILSGSCLKAHEESVSHQLLCISTTSHVTESELHNFWNLESIGIYAQKDGPPKDPVLDTFEETVKYVDGRTKVAPIKRVTLPRLELLGALLSARLMHFVKSALHLDDCVRLVYWTDSKVALSWIKGFQPRVSDKHVNVSGLDLSEREIVRKWQLDKFWRMWSDDYLKNLPPAVKSFRSNCNVKKGSVVLLREDNVPRMNWPLGVITDLYPGRDGIVRSVNVKTAKGMLCRPVQKIHDLEICYDVNSAGENSEVPVECPDEEVDKVDTDKNDETENPEQVKVSRSGRVVKPRTVLDL